MKTLSTELRNHLAGENVTVAVCLKITRQDGTELGFTNHDRDITFEGVTYEAEWGYTPSELSGTANLAVDNLTIRGITTVNGIAREDLITGKYDQAEAEIFLVNYRDLTQGRVILRRGWLGEVVVRDNGFEAEFRGLAQAFQQEIGEVYTPGCRADLGDSRCGINLDDWTETGQVTAVGVGKFAATITEQHPGQGHETYYGSAGTDWFTGGLLTWTSGGNAGSSVEVRKWDIEAWPGLGNVHVFYLALPTTETIQVGDQFEVYAGCLKTVDHCAYKFSNIANFRGEPYVPGPDVVNNYPDYRGP